MQEGLDYLRENVQKNRLMGFLYDAKRKRGMDEKTWNAWVNAILAVLIHKDNWRSLENLPATDWETIKSSILGSHEANGQFVYTPQEVVDRVKQYGGQFSMGKTGPTPSRFVPMARDQALNGGGAAGRF